jgi:sugar phosphate isomerase/epimerase
MMFTKSLAPLSVPELGRAIADIGLDGVDLTVRPGGHVTPERADTNLPVAVAQLADCGLSVGLITSGITSAADPDARRVFEAAAASGVGELKLGYWMYTDYGTLAAAIDAAARQLDGLAALAERTGVRANIHIHSGPYLSALAPVVHRLLDGRDPRHVGAYVDPGHMMTEGGVTGWQMGLDLLAPWISLVAVKDKRWHPVDDNELGKPRWKTHNIPLDQGFVPWPDVFACLRRGGFDGWVSLHSEYQGPHSWRDLSTTEVLAQTAADFAYLRGAVERSEGQPALVRGR